MLTINTNLSSLLAQFNTKTSTNQLNLAIERMTTGYKINHAKDNAANYSISTNMSTKIGGLQVAEENALQGIEMMSTMSENLSLIEDKLTRMRALAVQTQNGTYAGQSLAAISAEAESLFSEINRINEGATFNGIKLFNTGKAEVTNAGKELELNEQGFLQEVIQRDTSTMVTVESIDETQTLAVGTYSVSSVEDLLKLHNMSKAGLLETGSEFVLANDIDLKEYCKAEEANGGWTPIKLSSATLDGNGYTISNLYINRPSSGYQAFLADGAVSAVKNLKLENVDITAASNVGAFMSGYVGNGVGNYVNCSATGKIVAKKYVGAIVGAGFYSNVTSCYADMDITGTDSVGGLYGCANYSSCTSSYFKGSVTGNNNIGGIVGSGYGTISNSKVVATICGNSNVGGICSDRPVSRSYFDGSIVGNDKVGGISGAGTVTNCIVEGAVRGTSAAGVFTGTGTSVKDSFYYKKNNTSLGFTADDAASTISNITDITIPTDYTLQIGTGSDESTSTVSCTTYIDFGGLKTLLDGGIESVGSIQKIDDLLNVVSLKQTELGMMENRLMSVLDEINIKYDNLVSSRSTIRDADIAEVSAHYIQQQILQQASATLMATANQSPAIALQLT